MRVDPLIVSLVLVVIGALAFVLWLLTRQRQDLSRLEEKLTQEGSFNLLAEWLRSMDTSLRRQTETVSQELQRTNESIAQRLDSAAQLLTTVGKEVGHVREIGQQIRAFQEMLRAPKFRGTLGEEILRDLISQILPRDAYAFQHRFRNGLIVDAVVRTDSGLIPIDSKFPLESFARFAKAEEETEQQAAWNEFHRVVRQHVDSVANKYILPEEETLPFALLYVPSEAVYHEIVSRDNQLLRHARKHNVLLVSPNAFYYFLQIVLLGLQGQRIEEAARRILEALAAVRRETDSLGEALRTLEGHLGNARGATERVRSRFETLRHRLEATERLSLEEPGKDESTP